MTKEQTVRASHLCLEINRLFDAVGQREFPRFSSGAALADCYDFLTDLVAIEVGKKNSPWRVKSKNKKTKTKKRK